MDEQVKKFKSSIKQQADSEDKNINNKNKNKSKKINDPENPDFIYQKIREQGFDKKNYSEFQEEFGFMDKLQLVKKYSDQKEKGKKDKTEIIQEYLHNMKQKNLRAPIFTIKLLQNLQKDIEFYVLNINQFQNQPQKQDQIISFYEKLNTAFQTLDIIYDQMMYSDKYSVLYPQFYENLSIIYTSIYDLIMQQNQNNSTEQFKVEWQAIILKQANFIFKNCQNIQEASQLLYIISKFHIQKVQQQNLLFSQNDQLSEKSQKQHYNQQYENIKNLIVNDVKEIILSQIQEIKKLNEKQIEQSNQEITRTQFNKFRIEQSQIIAQNML
ncbi:hypothetical protein PPERSA_12239 [Pseudocohnilembus persalinus]|uniref:Uncharacterized protein n=1 Tax=Pseudocohnilembus persalinus TaxID=266149 RepID=A0A0V0R5M5_PSEPJ|nr:hypothetical protein PPERSA_12239 [Pseudocohnilembus persalinus]|eukprot:KRX09496.1 hypothetical protein PPERSA_12239 [Pseudocohnilembus persalinus]